MQVSRNFKEIRRKRLPIFMSGADHAFQASFERQTDVLRQRHRLTNWREYDASSLRNRGGLTISFTPEAIAGWKARPRTTPGARRHYSFGSCHGNSPDLRAVFRLPSPERRPDRIYHENADPQPDERTRAREIRSNGMIELIQRSNAFPKVSMQQARARCVSDQPDRPAFVTSFASATS